MYGCEFENFQRKISEKLLLFSGNFQKFVNYLCQSAVSKSSIAK